MPHTAPRDDVRVDMTPMIDAVFLLIIFFLCIDFRSLDAKLPAYLPKDRGVSQREQPLVEQLPVRIVCDAYGDPAPRTRGGPVVDHATGRRAPFLLTGHQVHWLVGPRRLDDVSALARELGGVAADPSRLVADPARPGMWRTLPVVVEPGPGATYGDVAATVDAVRAAGFDDVSFGGGSGRWSR